MKIGIILVVAIAVAMAKAIVTVAVEESLIIAIAIMTAGLIDYSGNATRSFANWLVLTGAIIMFFSLFGNFAVSVFSILSSSAFVILFLLAVILFFSVIILITGLPDGKWHHNKTVTVKELG